MSVELSILIIHQALFQGMFATKNILLKRRLGQPIRGWNKEATISIVFFVIYIAVDVLIAFISDPVGSTMLLDRLVVTSIACVILFMNLTVSALSLMHLRDSWRVGVLEDQSTDLVTTGIYRYSRNPYFLSYMLMFLAYPILLQNWILLVLSAVGFGLVHWMVLKEERYLLEAHGNSYKEYMQSTRRYL